MLSLQRKVKKIMGPDPDVRLYFNFIKKSQTLFHAGPSRRQLERRQKKRSNIFKFQTYTVLVLRRFPEW